MRIFEQSAYSMMRGFLVARPKPVILDIGAHVGSESVAIRSAFPDSVVYAFEPSRESFVKLSGTAEITPGLKPIHAAVSDHEGEAVISIARNPELNSLLAMSAQGVRQWGASAETVERERVRVRTLDAWAEETGVARIDAMKIDVQGAELRVLRGAERVLKNVAAVYAEALIAELYDGCATLSDIDIHLRERGFVFHQIHSMFMKGPEQQLSHVDALWVRADILARHRDALANGGREAELRMGAALRRLAEDGLRRVAVYGAGEHTRRAAAALFDPPVEVVAIIDDDTKREGSRAWGHPVMPLERAGDLDLDAVVISSDAYEGALGERAERALDPRVRIVRLYSEGSTERSAVPCGASHAP